MSPPRIDTVCVHSLAGWNGSTTALAVWRSGLPTAGGHDQQAMGTQPGSWCISRAYVSCADGSVFPASLVALLLLLLLAGWLAKSGNPIYLLAFSEYDMYGTLICMGGEGVRGAMAECVPSHAAVTPPRCLSPYVLPIHAHCTSRA